jgi:hypothetical protein
MEDRFSHQTVKMLPATAVVDKIHICEKVSRSTFHIYPSGAFIVSRKELYNIINLPHNKS